MIHKDITCDEYKTRARAYVEEDETSKVLADQIARGVVMKCPGCQIPLARVAGCDFLTCFVCKMEICWITKKPRRGPNGCNCQPTKKCHPQCGNCH